MSERIHDDLAIGTGQLGQDVVKAFKALKLSNPTTLPPNTGTTPKSGEHVQRDSGYVSEVSTPEPVKFVTPSTGRQLPFLQNLGLSRSSKSMIADTTRRLIDVQKELGKMLQSEIRGIRGVVIRAMMLSRTGAHVDDAEAYILVLCEPTFEHRVRGFFKQDHVKALCQPDDEDTPSFKVLVVGHPIKLRASTSGITIQCDAEDGFDDDPKTFCGIRIRLCDELGYSKHATLGGTVKIMSTDEQFQLYGLTAGHIMASLRTDTGEDDARHTKTYGSEVVCQDIATHELGKLVDMPVKPFLDWALFELNAHKPNYFVSPNQKTSTRDLHLPRSTASRPRTEDVCVSIVCAYHKIKRGVLSPQPIRVLLDPWEEFTDAYTVSLEDSLGVVDGDSGAWVVDEELLEVHGHVVADDVFGDAYVISMNDIVTDIKRCFGAVSVDLPSGLDVLSSGYASFHAAKVDSLALASGKPIDTRLSQYYEREPDNRTHGIVPVPFGTQQAPFLSPEDVYSPEHSTSTAVADYMMSPDSGYSSLDGSVKPSPQLGRDGLVQGERDAKESEACQVHDVEQKVGRGMGLDIVPFHQMYQAGAEQIVAYMPFPPFPS